MLAVGIIKRKKKYQKIFLLIHILPRFTIVGLGNGNSTPWNWRILGLWFCRVGEEIIFVVSQKLFIGLIRVSHSIHGNFQRFNSPNNKIQTTNILVRLLCYLMSSWFRIPLTLSDLLLWFPNLMWQRQAQTQETESSSNIKQPENRGKSYQIEAFLILVAST